MKMPSALHDLTPAFLLILFTATLGPLLFGYHLAELNAPQEVITCVKKGIKPTIVDRVKVAWGGQAVTETAHLGASLPQCLPMDSLQFGLVSSLFTLGGLVGALVAGPITSQHGRLRAMLVTGVPSIIGPLLEALAPNVATMTIGRFVSGLGAGAATVIVPIYISEIAPPGRKGFYGSFTQVMINFGILIAQLQGLFLSRGKLWRIILGVGGAIALAQSLILLLAGQESPKWLADNGKPSKAKKALRVIRGRGVDIEKEVEGWGLASERDLDDEEESLITNEDHMHEHSREDDGEGTSSRSDGHHEGSKLARKAGKEVKRDTVSVFNIVTNPQYSSAVLSVTMIMLAQQLCGINSIVMYGVSLLSDLLDTNSALLNVATSALNVLITIAAAPLVERLGRKTCLLNSIAGMGISSILLAIGIMRVVPILSAIAVITFVASFGLGLGPVPFILSSELVNSEAVGATQSWALAANWIATFLVAQFFPIINERLGKGTVYFIFAAFAAVFGAFTAWFVPETKGKSDADEVWGRKKVQAD